MSTTYVVSYDLMKPGQNYDDLIEYLESFSVHWHIMQSTWIVRCNMTAYELATEILKFMDSNDKLLVNELVSNCAWRVNNQQGSDWLKDRTREAAT